MLDGSVTILVTTGLDGLDEEKDEADEAGNDGEVDVALVVVDEINKSCIGGFLVPEVLKVETLGSNGDSLCEHDQDAEDDSNNTIGLHELYYLWVWQ